MTIEEIKSKLQTIRNNNALPEKQKGMLIDKYEKLLGDLTPAATPKPKAEKKTTEPKLKAQKDPETGETFYPVSYEYFDRVWKSKKDPRREIALTIGWDVFSYDEFEELGNGDFEKGLRQYLKKIPGASLDFQPDEDGKIYRIVFKDLKTTSKKPAKTTDESDYDCDDLIEEAKERKAKALAAYEKRKNAPKKSAATKSKDAVIRAEKSVEKGVKKGDISVSEIEKIIAEYEDAIKKLKALLESAKNKMGNGGSVDPEEVEHILMKAQGIKEHHCKCHDKMANGGGVNVYSSDEMYELNVFDGKTNNLLETKRFRARNQREAKSEAEDLEYFMHKKYGDYLHFKLGLAKPLMANGGGVDFSYYAILGGPSPFTDREMIKNIVEPNLGPNFETIKMFEGGKYNPKYAELETKFPYEITQDWKLLYRSDNYQGYARISPDGNIIEAGILESFSIQGVYYIKSKTKMANGGRLKESDIEVGNKYELMNGETIEIKRLFIENGDENWVAFTRSSAPGQTFENSLNGLKNFLNNWRKKMATGGGIEKLSVLKIVYPPIKKIAKPVSDLMEKLNVDYSSTYFAENLDGWEVAFIDLSKQNNPKEIMSSFEKLKDRHRGELHVYSLDKMPKFENGGVVGQEITFDFQGEDKQGVIKEITDSGDYIVMTPDGRTLLAERDIDVISLGKMSKDMPREKKRFGFFETGGSMYDQGM
jgi:hypothetical protein